MRSTGAAPSGAHAPHRACPSEVQLVRATRPAPGGLGARARAAAAAAALVAGAVTVAAVVGIAQVPRPVVAAAALGPATAALRAPLAALHSDGCCDGRCRGAPAVALSPSPSSPSSPSAPATTCSASEEAGRLCECLVLGVPGAAGSSRPAADVAAMSIFDRRADVVSGLYKAGLCSLSECLAASDAELAAMCLSCAPGYLQVPGDVGEKHLPAVTVTSCADCAKLCDGIAGCRAYSCGKTTRQCKLDSLTVPVMPSEASDKDVTVCSKEASLALPPQLPQPAGRRLLGECDCSRCTGVGLQGLQGTGSSDCADDPSWVDPVNGDAKCSSWVGYGCDDAWDGYSPASVVKAKCPRTCGLCTAEPSTTSEKDSLPASTPAPEPPEDVKAATLEKREVDTESTDRGSGSTHYLDRQDVDCKGNPISGFKMQTTDEMKKISYKLQCGTGANLDVSEVSLPRVAASSNVQAYLLMRH
jgi:hypothetical protein